MEEEKKVDENQIVIRKRPIIITFVGIIVMILVILATLDISNRNLNSFVSDQQKYILAIEGVILAIFVVEMLSRVIRALMPAAQMGEHGGRLRLLIRIIGYAIALTSVISILSSNPTLGISVGAIAGIVVAFATQNVLGNVISTIVILNTRMIHLGEEITISTAKGVVSDINLTHTILSAEQNVIFVPNSLIVSSIVQRKKRKGGKNAGAHDW